MSKNIFSKFKVNDLTVGPVWKVILLFFIPIAAGTIVQQLYNTADALIVGRYCGTEALAATGGSPSQIINLIVGFCVALTAGASVVLAQYFGEKNYASLRKATATSLIAAGVIGLLITVLGYLATPSLLRLMKTPEEIMDMSIDYLHCLFLGAFFVMIYNMGAGILRACGDSRRPFIYLCACCVANIVLDYIAVAILDMGVLGAGIATAGSQIISSMLVVIRIFTAKEEYAIETSQLRTDGAILKKMSYFGIPSALQQLMYSASNALIMAAINTIGTNSVAAWTLTSKLDGIYWATMTAAGTAVLAFAGQNFGAGRIDRVRKGTKASLIMFMSFTVVSSGILLFAVPVLAPQFDSNPEVIAIVCRIFKYFVLAYPIWPVIEVLSGILKGIGDAVVPVIILGVGTALFRVVWVYTVFAKYGTIEVLSAIYPLSWVVTAIAITVRYLTGKWRGEGSLEK